MPLFQLLKGFIRIQSLFLAWVASLAILGSIPWTHEASAATVQITPKNGVPSSWELVSVEENRIVVRKGGARFEFSKDNIQKVSNPEVSALVDQAQALLNQVDQGDPEKFMDLESKLQKILPSLDSAAKQFSWLIPELVETRNRAAESLKNIEKTLDLTGSFQKDLEAIEKMANGRDPVAANWEEVLDKTLASAREIPIEEIRTEVLSELDKFRRSIRLSLVRRTEEAESRVRDRAEELLRQLDRGEIDPAQWALVLRDLRRQVSEQVPDADLRLELEEYLNGIETESQDKLAIAEEKILQREIKKSLDALDPLVLDTAQTEKFSAMVSEVSAEIAKLPSSETKTDLLGMLETYSADHQEALAQLQRANAPDQPTNAETEPVQKNSATDWKAYLTDWKILAVVGGVVALLVILQVALAKKKPKKKKGRSASEIEDVRVVLPEGADMGWAGGQDEDLSAILGAKSKSASEASQEIVASAGDDLFGDLEVETEPPPSETAGETLVNVTKETEKPAEDPFGFQSAGEEAPVEGDTPPKADPEAKGDDPFGFSKVFSEDEPDEASEQSVADEPESSESEADDLFGPPPSEEEIRLLEPGEDPLAVHTGGEESPPDSPAIDSDQPETSKEPPPADADDPFGLLSTPSSPTEEREPKEEKKEDDLFDLSESSEADEEDLFGFGSYFEESDKDSDKDK
ncbi:MAG: hypothetical protein KC994_10425 [Candidatus Omnitrophica bacterium]|nr:hypothetical protein [Candidatus Omnitrophota bacterium]